MSKSSQFTITVTPELDAFIRERVASGRFDTVSDVVRELQRSSRGGIISVLL